MADKIERIIADTFLQMAEGLETGNFGKKPKIALTGMGSEHGEENAMEAAKMAAFPISDRCVNGWTCSDTRKRKRDVYCQYDRNIQCRPY